jgi:hypothetical protein
LDLQNFKPSASIKYSPIFSSVDKTFPAAITASLMFAFEDLEIALSLLK